MRKINILLFVIFLFVVNLAYANEYCRSEGCLNPFYYAGGSTFETFEGAFTSITPSNYDYTAFTSCSVETALYAPTGGNLNGDLSDNEYFYVTSNTRIVAYSTSCVYLGELNLPSNKKIIAEVNIVDYDYDNLPELAVITNSSIMLYNFSGNTFNLQDNFSNYPTVIGTTPMYGSCSNTYCLSTGNELNVTITSLISGISTEYVIFTGSYSANIGHFGNAVYNDLTYFYVCKYTSSSSKSCVLIKQDGTKSFVNSSSMGAGSGTIDNGISYPVVINGNFRAIVSFYYTTPGLQKRFFDSISNFAGTTLYNTCKNAGSDCVVDGTIYYGNHSSTWAVGNYDKTIGTKLLCHMFKYNYTGQNKSVFECWDDTFTNKYFNIEITLPPLNDTIPPFFTLVDINHTSDYMSIATSDGIYQINFLNQSVLYKYAWNYSMAASDFSSSVLLASNTFNSLNPPLLWASYPTIAYTDTTHSIITHPVPSLTATCGNLVCEYTESFLTCPGDCIGVSTGLSCTRDNECPASYPNCLGNVCVRGLNTSLTCLSNLDCPYMTPICIQGYCVKTVSTVIDNTTTNNTLGIIRDQENEQGIRDLLDILFFGSTFFKLLIAIVLTLVIMSESAKMSKGSPFVIALAGLFSLILFTVVGMIPIFVVLILLIGMVLFLIYGRALFPQSSG